MGKGGVEGMRERDSGAAFYRTDFLPSGIPTKYPLFSRPNHVESQTFISPPKNSAKTVKALLERSTSCKS